MSEGPDVRRFPRLGALLGLLALLAVGCSDVPEEVGEPLEEAASELRSIAEDAGVGEEERGGDGDVGNGAEQDPQADDGAGGGPGDAGDGGADGGEEPDDGPEPGVDDLGAVGANGRAMLRSSHPTMVVEVDVQQGVDPDPAALDHLLEVVGSVADKPNGIVQAGGNRFTSDRSSWSPQDLRAVAEEHRSNYSDAQTVAVYVLYVRGRFHDEDAIGVAYNASEFAVFPERWRDTLGQTLGSTTAVERAVLTHEAGHLFGLVNLTYESRFDREDPDHPGHSSERDSVMHWAIETTAIGQVFSGPPPDDFNRADRADLRFLRTGSY